MQQKDHSKRNFALVSASNILAAFLDLFLTYVGTPNLSMEGNPFVQEFSLGWTWLIVINLIVTTGLILMAYYAHIHYKQPCESNETIIKRYINEITYGDPDFNSFMCIHWPKYWSPQIACMCWAVTIAVPIARLFIIFEWILIDFRIYLPQYFRFVLLFPMGRVDFFVAVILSWILSFVWIQLAFNKNLDKIRAQVVTQEEKDGKD